MRWLRYVALGDSLTAGTGDEGADQQQVGWARRLAHTLDVMCGPCRLVNLATGGATLYEVVTEQLPLLYRHYLDPRPERWRRVKWTPPVIMEAPDLVTITVGMNDLLSGERFELEQFGQVLGQMVRLLTGQGCTVVTMTFPNVASRIAACSGVDDEEAIGVLAYAIGQLNQTIVKETENNGGLWVPMMMMLDPVPDELFRPGDIHPAVAGHQLMAYSAADLLLRSYGVTP